MKLKLITVLLFSLAFASCIKDQTMKIVNTGIMGRWVSDDGKLQIKIVNTTGEGFFYNVTDYTNEQGRFLRIDDAGTVTIYQVESIKNDDMYLMDAKNTHLHFARVEKW